MRRLILASIFALAGCFAAQAQSGEAYNTPGGGSVPGAVAMCLNVQGKAVPTDQSGACPGGSGGSAPSLGTGVVGIGAGTTGAVTATLAGAANVVTYICGLDISAAGGTAAVSPVTITGLFGGTFTYQNILSGNSPFVRNFSPCVPASAVNTSIVITTTADGTATAVDVQTWGYQK